ncbi:MAG: 1-deoxy-D-xylulose-5-phosphate synthase [Ruminococcaceae bacterium]|nr:1-deoxy-D-xylulose-5-phosphate synthase [Oscillospiraceae bacterium]
MENFEFLGKLNLPDDLKKLNMNELETLATEIRTKMIKTVSQNGGHLSSNLGVVELSIAMHRMFNSPNDKFVWDVGHQVYAHKLLTGRVNEFDTLRTENGISGFCAPNESEHDTFYSGHSSTSISSALGIAEANKRLGKNNYTVAVIGDGALTGGMAYEALNNAGRSGTRLIVVLNDNEMSISENVGSMARYLAVVRSKPEYNKLKAKTESTLNKIPLIGSGIARFVSKIKSDIKSTMYESTFFEDLGFKYMGPIDGHNLEHLCEALDSAKLVNAPVLLHISTVKGKGYDFAEKSPSTYHGISKFNVETGEPVSSGANFSSVFGDELCALAGENDKVCAITAAMALGTGLKDFSEKFADRFYDVGIAEEHAVTFASGLAKGGMIPVVALYSTFLQRAYDQLVHDGTLQEQKVIIGVDRAGFVGEDGVTHQGLLDVSLINSIPNATMYSPFTFELLRKDLRNAVNNASNLTIIRYPRGGEIKIPNTYVITDSEFDYFDNNSSKLIVSYGRVTAEVINAVEQLKNKGINFSIISLNKIKPISDEVYDIALKYSEIYFYEESVRSGSIGQSFADILCEKCYNGRYEHIAVNDSFVAHATVKSLLKKYNLDTESIVEKFSEKLNG